jgi:hypothetical protein
MLLSAATTRQIMKETAQRARHHAADALGRRAS